MHTNLIFEWNVAREKQQDWLRQAAQERCQNVFLSIGSLLTGH
jgi:hypothetical protein